MATRKLLKKIIKNGEVYELPNSSDYVDLTSSQTVAWTKTFTSEPVLPSKDTTASSSKTAPATEYQVKAVADDLATLDSGVVKTTWNQTVWGVKTFTSEPILPSKTSTATNDWTKPATEAQVKAVADSIVSYSEVSKSDMDTWTSTTAWIVSAKSIADYVSWRIGTAVNYKGQVSDYDSLPANPTAWDMYNVVAKHTTTPKFDAWTNVVWSGTAWDPMSEMVDLSNLVDLTTNQTIWGTKTFTTSPVVPSKTSDATNSWTAIATEAQVYKKLDSSSLGNATITVNQGWTSAWSFTTNQSSNGTIDLHDNLPKTQIEYDALPSSKAADWNSYLIYE